MLEQGLKVPNYEIPDYEDDFAVRSEDRAERREGEDNDEAGGSADWEEDDDWETSPEEVWDDEEVGVFGLGKDDEDWGECPLE